MEKSLNEETYEKLKYDIMNFEVLPGDSISAQKIALRYNVSRTPAREAIVNLEKEGLLKVIPQSGTYVACINCKRSEQEWFVRKSLEIGMVDAIFKNASADMLDKMAELNNRLMLSSPDISEGCPVISFSSVFCGIFFCPAAQPLSSSTAVSRSGNTLRYMVYSSFLRR